MKASIIFAVASAAFVSAAPPVHDNFNDLARITDLFINQTLDNKVTHLSFKLSARDADKIECSADNLPYPERTVYTCGDSKYQFALHTGTDAHPFALDISYKAAPAARWWGVGNINVLCHGINNGVESRFCVQNGEIAIGLAQ
ncbi:hypothetical protein E4U58_007134 [Claviceps cyperi]|nr:hypothetical protein E4U58_007134 [Claviceps cyperi]